jgi:hypothetical protein
MARAEVRVVVLFEDQAQEAFMRALVKRLKLKPVRWENCRNSVGVLQRLGVEVDALRARKHQRNLALVVVIDADEKGLVGRTTELEARVASEARDGARKDDERITFMVPALEIETWYVHFCCPEARPVDETRDYKLSREWRELAKNVGAAARRAAEVWPEELSPDDPASVKAAVRELARAR